ncbi:four-carbon acid sugar kinase family protein [Spirosoma telluris]
MIAVIADDLTGAAELAGIGLTYGLIVELAMSVNPQSTPDLLVIATDARSVSEQEAVLEMTEVSKALQAMKPELMYKKIDSVLRGHVIAEVQAQLAVLGLPKALLVPANPALGRTLVNGHYYVHGKLIHQTHFAQDPEFPIKESDVQKRFDTKSEQVMVLAHQADFPERGIIIGEVEKEADLHIWASRLDSQMVVGGGSNFFRAILDALTLEKQLVSATGVVGGHKLYVCGTAFGESISLVKKALNDGHAISYMPNALTSSCKLAMVELEKWVAEIVNYFRQNRQVIIAIDPTFVDNSRSSAIHLRIRMAMAVQEVMKRVRIHELIIEGGSTASAVLRQIGISRLVPVQELAPGVVRSEAIEQQELYITMKPGSYSWPTELWTF